MTYKKEPFRNYTLDEDKKDDRIILTISLNKQEQEWVTELMEDFNTNNKSTALKTAAFIGRNVIHNTFSRPLLKYLFSADRVRFEHRPIKDIRK